MLDIEGFSLCAWSTDQARTWNVRKGRGIKYRGWSWISDSERFFPNELKRRAPVQTEEKYGRAFTWGT